VAGILALAVLVGPIMLLLTAIAGLLALDMLGLLCPLREWLRARLGIKD
jgi:hypothetical protein